MAALNLNLLDDPYQILGLEPNATEVEIKQAYFKLVREHPPERDPDGFKRIRAAYEKLRAGRERASTDLLLIDRRDAKFDASMLQPYEFSPPELSLEMLREDLLALEATLLIEQICAI